MYSQASEGPDELNISDGLSLESSWTLDDAG